MRRAVITFASVSLALLASLWALDRFAAPQDLPWKPFDLDQPIGLATHVKLARIGANYDRCRQALAAGGVRFESLPPRREGQCAVLSGVELLEGPAPLSPAHPVMSCSEALALAVWERHVVQPAARDLLAAQVVRIEHFGTYNCRPIRGEADHLSEHAFADAIDISAFDLASGRQVSVLKDYRAAGPGGAFLRRVSRGACGVFGHALGPDYNADHHDHFHLDMGAWLGPWGMCR